MPRKRILALLLLPAVLVAGCGGPAATKGSRHGSRGVPVLAKAPPAPRTLRPVATATTLGTGGVTTLTADLTGQGQDTIAVRTTPAGDGQVRITSGHGVVFRRQHVSGASVLRFGRAHLPVLLLQDSLNLCGSGGCVTTAYTWSPSRAAMLPVQAPTAEAFRYLPARHQFAPTQVPQLGALFGYVVPGKDGIVLNARTYDAWQHDMAQSYAYAPGLSPTGGWIAVGPVRYGPSGRDSGAAFSGAGQALLALLSARSLGFRAQVQQVTGPGTATDAIWRNLSVLGRWQGSLFPVLPAPQVQSSGATATASDRVAGLAGQGPAAQLEAYEVTAVLRRVGSAYYVASAHMAPLNVKVKTALQVLAAIRADRSLLAALAHAGDPPLLVQAVGQIWQVSIAGVGGMQDRPWVEIDAMSGAMHRSA